MRSSGRALLRAAAEALELPLDEGGVDACLAFAALLEERAIPLGMVSRGDTDRVLERHVVDSLRAAPVVREVGASRAVDLGSGAGLPGVILAIALPEVEIVLAEARSRRAAFLELVVERLGLRNSRVHVGPVESLDLRFGLCTARAFAPLRDTWDVARRVLEPGGSLVLFAGAAERVPDSLPGAASLRRVRPGGDRVPPGTSVGSILASGGDLVIIGSS